MAARHDPNVTARKTLVFLAWTVQLQLVHVCWALATAVHGDLQLNYRIAVAPCRHCAAAIAGVAQR